MAKTEEISKGVPCCPEVTAQPTCDFLDFHYRQLFPTTVTVNDRRQSVQVEVLIHARLERCAGALELGDLTYSTTLFPGERVRLFSTDRRSRFSFDSSSNLSYRNEQTTEEHFYMASMERFLSDLTVRDSSRSASRSQHSAEAHTETSGILETIFSGPSVGVSGSYSSSSSREFLRELRQHAEAAHSRAEMGTRAASTVSIGEVNTRSHAEGQSEDHFESSSREFRNPNRCHAITFYFYRLNKTQTIRFKIVAIRRRVVDPAADTRVTNLPQVSRGGVTAIPTAILASDPKRLEVEERARQSVLLGNRGLEVNLGAMAAVRPTAFAPTVVAEPLSEAVRERALRQVDQDLVRVGLLDKVGGQLSEQARLEFSFERKTSFPTPGFFVRGCLDECSICEESLQEEINLGLEQKRLQNEHLKRQIELMEKDQEHRCCPEATE
jgi:hypothetical protein